MNNIYEVMGQLQFEEHMTDDDNRLEFYKHLFTLIPEGIEDDPYGRPVRFRNGLCFFIREEFGQNVYVCHDEENKTIEDLFPELYALRTTPEPHGYYWEDWDQRRNAVKTAIEQLTRKIGEKENNRHLLP